ncbi:transcription factor grauzone-like [Wyeomyia smithii]|uniref:transcription factor grauzone-like n=1 Tax=Wyeomyia smithii TaxID=174621 RepID=UPI0024681C23|nr:transcription factor grauzone-like [Wyeomyia smithii]
MESNEQHCNFCGQIKKEQNIINSVDGFSEQLSTLRVEEVIIKHFWFKEEDTKNLRICEECWNKLLAFHLFYCQVEQLFKPQELKIKTENRPISPEPEYHDFLVEFDSIDIKREEELQITDSALAIDDKTEDSNADSKNTNEESEESSTVTISNDDILLHCRMICEVCSEEFESFGLLKRHYSRAHNQNGYVRCCNSRFSYLNRLKEHLRVHVNPESFQCSDCTKNFKSKRSLREHRLLMHIPEEQKLFQCALCSKKYAKQHQLNQHLVNHKLKDQSQVVFTCHQCQKPFRSQGYLRNHVRSVHVNTSDKFLCDICSKTFKTAGALKVHLSEHRDTERAQCTLCGKYMKNTNTLRKHLALHREETIECQICGKKSPNSHALRKHIQDQHTKTRSHQCTMCEKAFKRAIVLKEHMATHTGQLLYSCVHCGKEFKSSANLCSHRKKKHPEEWSEYQKQKNIDGVKTYSIVNG